MKLLKLLSMSILIASALLLSAAKDGIGASRNPRAKQHKGAAEEEPKGAQQRQQEPTVPLSVFQATQSALSEVLHTIRAQQEAAAEHDRSQKDNWDKAAVIADYLLFLVGCLYTYFAWGQWGAIDAQAKSAERTFKLTQRAEITLGRPDGTLAEIIEPKVGEPLRAKIFLTNSGRTAARDFRAKEAIGIGDRTSTMDLGSEPVLKHATVRGGFTAQSGPITSTIASGGVFTHIARSAESLTEEDADKIKARQLWIRIMGQYEYNDGVGSDEWRAYFLDFDPTVGIFVATDMPLRRDTWS